MDLANDDSADPAPPLPGRPEADVAEADDPSTAKHVPRGKTRVVTEDLTDAAPQEVMKAVPPIGALGGVNDTLGTREGQNQLAKPKEEEKKESLRIHIELNLDVELHLTARVKGDVTIGLL